MTANVTITDLFCGAGGSSSGAIQVPGVRVRMAANHWRLAVETHNTNHPDADHDCADLSQVDPRRYPRTDIHPHHPLRHPHRPVAVRDRPYSPRRPGHARPHRRVPRRAVITHPTQEDPMTTTDTTTGPLTRDDARAVAHALADVGVPTVRWDYWPASPQAAYDLDLDRLDLGRLDAVTLTWRPGESWWLWYQEGDSEHGVDLLADAMAAGPASLARVVAASLVHAGATVPAWCRSSAAAPATTGEES